MKLFKNIEISKLFAVNPTTVTNWIDSSQKGLNNLELAQKGNRYLVIDNAHNRFVMNDLVEQGKKYRPKSTLRRVVPNPEFYEIFDFTQIAEIISGVENYKTIPHKYSYFNGGAKLWQKYVNRSFGENLSNTVTNTYQMLKTSFAYIIQQIPPNHKVNIIDIGVGDSRPVRSMLESLIEHNLLNSYIPIDYSPEMLEIAEKNIKDWFGKNLKMESYLRDISTVPIRDILFKLSNPTNGNKKVINIVLFLGSTIENYIKPEPLLLNIVNSLSKSDLLLVGQSLFTPSATIYFSFKDQEKTPYRSEIVPNLMGISSELYSTHMFFEEESKARILKLVFEIDVHILFKHDEFEKELFLRKGESIEIWRHNHHEMENVIKLMKGAGLETRFVVTSEDNAQIITASYLKPDLSRINY